jgi:hypothetical protein
MFLYIILDKMYNNFLSAYKILIAIVDQTL